MSYNSVPPPSTGAPTPDAVLADAKRRAREMAAKLKQQQQQPEGTTSVTDEVASQEASSDSLNNDKHENGSSTLDGNTNKAIDGDGAEDLRAKRAHDDGNDDDAEGTGGDSEPSNKRSAPSLVPASSSPAETQSVYSGQTYVDPSNPSSSASTSASMNRPGLGAMITEIYPVPNHLVGWIIGKSGDTIRKLEVQSGAKIQCAPNAGEPERNITISGSPAVVEAAKQLIQEVIAGKTAVVSSNEGESSYEANGQQSSAHFDNAQSQYNQSSYALDGGNQNDQSQQQQQQQYQKSQQDYPVPPGSESTTLMIPSSKVGLIIGKQGDKIREIERQTGVKMAVIQTGIDANAPEKPLSITGLPESIQMALKIVDDLIKGSDQVRGSGGGGGNYGSSSSGFDPMQYPTSIMISVPREAVGLVIGAQGITIKRLQEEPNTKVVFQPENFGQPYRDLLVAGSEDSVRRIQSQVEGLIEEARSNVRQKGGQPTTVPGGFVKPATNFSLQDSGSSRRYGYGNTTVKLPCPADKVGLVIGTRGDTIKAIQAQSGARVILDKFVPPDAPEKLFVITGDMGQIERAQEMIREKLNMLDNNYYGGAYGSSGYGASSSTGGASYGNTAPAYGAPYAGYGQEYQAYPTAYAPQQSAMGATPAQDPYAGYDWAAYYAYYGQQGATQPPQQPDAK